MSTAPDLAARPALSLRRVVRALLLADGPIRPVSLQLKIVLATPLVAGGLADTLSFLVMIGMHGLAAEANPLAVHIAERFGLGVLLILKAFSVLFGWWLLVVVARARRRFAIFLAWGLGLLLGFAMLTNLLTIQHGA